MLARVLVISEDSGKQGVATVQRLLKAAVQLVVPGFDSRRLDARPLPKGDISLKAIRGNAWKDRRPTPEKLVLVRTIANELAQGRFVVFHVDSDSTWSNRSLSENRQKFHSGVRRLVLETLMAPPPLSTSPNSRSNVYRAYSASEAAMLAANLLVMHPCYSIEAWLYHATTELEAQCLAIHHDETHHALIRSWAADRALLEEVERPKDDALGTCVRDQCNELLAQHFPASKVDAVQKSWHEFVELLRASTALRERLEGP